VLSYRNNEERLTVVLATPFFLVLIVPLALICRQLQQYYIRTSREVARMESATKSPIFSHFQESLGGFSSIRAYGREEAFAQENINRLDANLRAYYGSFFQLSFSDRFVFFSF